MRVDLASRELTGDLTTCEFGRVSGEVSCSLVSSGMLWSDGTPITREDVLESYVLYREKAKSPRILDILSRTSISESSDGRVIFRNPNRPKEIYELLTLPILPREALKRSENMSITPDFPVSGPLQLTSRTSDEVLGLTQFLFTKNDAYTLTGAFAERIRVSFYGDNETEFARQVSDVDIILPSDIVVEPELSFQKVSINIPELATFFTNTQTLPIEWRTQFVEAVSGVIGSLPNQYAQTYPKDIPSATSLTGWTESGSIDALRRKAALLGMYPKSDVLATLRDRVAKLEQQIAAPVQIPTTNTHIQAPTNQTVYAASGSFVLRGKAPLGTTSVVVNGFRLTEFSGGEFAYRASRDIATLKPSKNVYTVRFERNGRILSQEILSVDLLTDPQAYDARSREIYRAYHPEETKAVLQKESQDLKDRIEQIALLPDNALVNESGKRAVIRLARLEGLEFDEAYERV